MQHGNAEDWNKMSEGLDYRLKQAVKLAGGAPAAAAKTGVGLSTVYTYMKLAPWPPTDFVYRLCAAAGVRPEWLFLGVLPISPGDDSGDWETDLPETGIGEKRIPVRDVSASAGYGIEALQEAPRYWVTFPLEMLMRLGNPDTLDMLSVDGDSMAPELLDRDLVMIDYSQNMLRDGLFVVQVEGRLFLKRVRVRGRNRAELVSTNPAYPPFEIEIPDADDDVHQDGAAIIGRVVWAGHMMS
jgi:phage repressor protein C with HTH and peptisase S24 domain